MDTFKICLLWDTFNPRIANRALIDMLTLKNVLRANRTRLIVTAPEEFKPLLDTLQIDHSLDYLGADDCRIYILEGSEVPGDVMERIPEDCPYETVYLLPNTVPPPTLTVDSMPYGGFTLPPLATPIAPTMRSHYQAPKKLYEPVLAPWT